MKVAIQIPLKYRSSTRVPNKNFRDLCGKPLCHWLIDELIKDIPHSYDIFVDSESESVMEIFSQQQLSRLKFHRRLEWYASDDSNGNHLLNQFSIQHSEYTHFFQIYVTAVTLRGGVINEAIEALLNSGDKHDSIFLVTEESGWIWSKNQALNYHPNQADGLPRSQDAMYLKETTGLYGITREAAFRTCCRVGKKPIFHVVNRQDAFDIDTMEDFWEAEKILTRDRI